MTLNKFEFIGIAASVIAMAAGLWFLRLESAPTPLAATTPTTNNVVPVVVGDNENQQAALAYAVIEAANSATGELERLIVDDISFGSGDPAVIGNTVTVHYIGRLQNGQEFDNSYERGAPFTFTIGEGRVIPGWEEGLKGMQVGGQRILVIPSDLAYGDGGFGPIPGKATLVFAVELLAIK